MRWRDCNRAELGAWGVSGAEMSGNRMGSHGESDCDAKSMALSRSAEGVVEIGKDGTEGSKEHLGRSKAGSRPVLESEFLATHLPLRWVALTAPPPAPRTPRQSMRLLTCLTWDRKHSKQLRYTSLIGIFASKDHLTFMCNIKKVFWKL